MSFSLNGGSQKAHIPRPDPDACVRNIGRVEFKRVGGASVTHEHRDCLDVLLIRQVQSSECMSECIGSYAFEANRADETLPISDPGLMGRRDDIWAAHQHGHRGLDPHCHHLARLDVDSCLDLACRVGIDRHRSSLDIRLGVVLDGLPVAVERSCDANYGLIAVEYVPEPLLVDVGPSSNFSYGNSLNSAFIVELVSNYLRCS